MVTFAKPRLIKLSYAILAIFCDRQHRLILSARDVGGLCVRLTIVLPNAANVDPPAVPDIAEPINFATVKRSRIVSLADGYIGGDFSGDYIET
jgi:hypothetical protein